MSRLPAYPLYLITSFVSGLALATAFTTNLVYQVEIVGLDALQLVLVGTVLEATVFLFEVPTGIVADMLSRRLSVIIGFALIGAGLALEGLVPLFVTVLVGQVIWGLGHTFTSGAHTAWLADELGENDLAAALIRGSQSHQAGNLVGIALSVLLAGIARNLPLVVAGSSLIALASFLVLTTPERGFQPRPTTPRRVVPSMWINALDGIRTIRRQSILILVLAVTFLYAIASEVLDRLTTPFLLETITLPSLGPLDSVAWFGLVAFISMALSVVVLEVVRRKLDPTDDRAIATTLLVVNIIFIASVAAFAAATNLAFALAMLWLRNPMRSANDPILNAWQNRFIPSRVRATVLSISGQFDAIGQIVGGPILGAIALGFSLRVSFFAAALVMAPVLVIYAWLRRRTALAAVIV